MHVRRRVNAGARLLVSSGMLPRALAATLVAVACLRPAVAAADPAKAWAAARAGLPATTEVLVGLDLTQLTRTSSFKMLLPLLLAKQPELRDGLALVKATCGFDPLTAIEAVVIGADKDQAAGALYVAVKGLDEARIATCMEGVANAQSAAAATIAVTRAGGITQLAVGADRLFVRWLGKDVIAVPLTFTDRAQLQAWTGGNKALARGKVGPFLRKLDTRAAVWGVSTRPEEFDGAKATSGYGALSTRGGVLAPELHIVLASAADATAMATRATTELTAKAAVPDLAASLKAVLSTVSVIAIGAEVVIKARIVEKELLGLIGALLRGA